MTDEVNGNASASLYKKMSGVMGRLDRIPKRGINQHFKYAYVTDADVLEGVRKAMAEEGLAFFVNTVDIEQDGNRTTGTYDVTFADGETGATLTVTWIGEALDAQDKGMSKALTGAIKYGLMKTFLISTGDADPDEGEPSGDTRTAQPVQTPAAHWIDDPKVRARFWAWTGKLTLTKEEVHKALDVESVHAYQGTMGDAKNKILDWVTDQAQAEITRADQINKIEQAVPA